MHIPYANEKVKIAGEFQAEEPGFCSLIRGAEMYSKITLTGGRRLEVRKQLLRQQVRSVVMPYWPGERLLR